MSIGLLGGSFNPAHSGHLAISQVALRRLQLDCLWWLVSPGNPLKDNRELAPVETRLKQASSVAQHPRIKVTGFERGLRDYYSRHTIAFLQQRFPATRFVWIMGADNLSGFHRWHDWQGVFSSLPIAVVDRPDYRLRGLAGRAAKTFERARIDETDAAGLAWLEAPVWTFLTLPLSPQSSSEIRGTKTKPKNR